MGKEILTLNATRERQKFSKAFKLNAVEINEVRRDYFYKTYWKAVPRNYANASFSRLRPSPV